MTRLPCVGVVNQGFVDQGFVDECVVEIFVACLGRRLVNQDDIVIHRLVGHDRADGSGGRQCGQPPPQVAVISLQDGELRLPLLLIEVQARLPLFLDRSQAGLVLLLRIGQLPIPISLQIERRTGFGLGQQLCLARFFRVATPEKPVDNPFHEPADDDTQDQTGPEVHVCTSNEQQCPNLYLKYIGFRAKL